MYISLDHIQFNALVESSDGTQQYMVSYGANRYLDSVKQNLSSGHFLKYDWSCTCKGWKYRKQSRGGYCKHIYAVANERILVVAESEQDVIHVVDSAALQNYRAGPSNAGVSKLDLADALAKSVRTYSKLIRRANGEMIEMVQRSDLEYDDIIANITQ